MYVVICNFPMGKAIVDFMDHTGIELDETTIFHLDGILLEGELKTKIVEANQLTGDPLKFIDYYTSAILVDGLEPVRRWDAYSEDLSIYGVFEMEPNDWIDVVAAQPQAEKVMRQAIQNMMLLEA